MAPVAATSEVALRYGMAGQAALAEALIFIGGEMTFGSYSSRCLASADVIPVKFSHRDDQRVREVIR
jgi:hypothetical protein